MRGFVTTLAHYEADSILIEDAQSVADPVLQSIFAFECFGRRGNCRRVLLLYAAREEVSGAYR